MKCEDVRISLDLFLQQDLAPTEMDIVKSHLSRCVTCSMELKEITQLTQELSGGPRSQAAPSYLEERIRQRFQQRYRKTRNVGRIAVAAVAVLAILTTAYAQARTGFLSDFLGFDRGVEEAMLRGAGQVVNESKTQDGITVNLHSLVADPNRSVVLYTIEGAPPEADSVWLGTNIEPHTGYWSNRYDIQNGIVKGQLETGGHRFTDRLKIQFNEIIFTQSHTMTVPIWFEDQYPRTITLPEGAGEVVIKQIELTGNIVRVTVQPALAGGYLAGQFTHLLLSQDGDPAFAMRVSELWSEWNVTNIDGQFELQFTYFEHLTSSSKPIVFNVKVDRKKVEQHTVIYELDKNVEVEPGLVLSLKRLISTASQTRIEYTIAGSVDILPDARVLVDGQPIDWMDGAEWDEEGNRVFTLMFEPTVSLENLEFVFLGYQNQHQEYRKVDIKIPISK